MAFLNWRYQANAFVEDNLDTGNRMDLLDAVFFRNTRWPDSKRSWGY